MQLDLNFWKTQSNLSRREDGSVKMELVEASSSLTGARKMMLLAVVRKVPENHRNLDLILKAIQLNLINYKITGDFAFLLPQIDFKQPVKDSNLQ